MGTIKKAFRVFTLLLLFLTFWTTYCYGVSPEQIFVWVSRHMDIEYAENMPEVIYLERQELQHVFQQLSQRSLEKWRHDHGESRADTIMASYLERVKGMFNPETEVIYVGNHLSQCEREAVLAHEITHYFQNRRDGPIDLRDYGAEDLRMFREIEAYQMEKRYKELYCDGSGHSQSNLAVWYAP